MGPMTDDKHQALRKVLRDLADDTSGVTNERLRLQAAVALDALDDGDPERALEMLDLS